jgi:hypothetical protein
VSAGLKKVFSASTLGVALFIALLDAAFGLYLARCRLRGIPGWAQRRGYLPGAVAAVLWGVGMAATQSLFEYLMSTVRNYAGPSSWRFADQFPGLAATYCVACLLLWVPAEWFARRFTGLALRQREDRPKVVPADDAEALR